MDSTSYFFINKIIDPNTNFRELLVGHNKGCTLLASESLARNVAYTKTVFDYYKYPLGCIYLSIINTIDETVGVCNNKPHFKKFKSLSPIIIPYKSYMCNLCQHKDCCRGDMFLWVK